MGLPQALGKAGPCMVRTPKPGLPGKERPLVPCQPLPAQLTRVKWLRTLRLPCLICKMGRTLSASQGRREVWRREALAGQGAHSRETRPPTPTSASQPGRV